MKKLLALLLVAIMAMSAVPALAEDDYSEHFSYSVSYIGASGAEEDYVYDYITEKFNVDFEMISYGWGDYATNASMMINGGTMLDMLTVDSNFGMIASFAEQGLIRPLPDNWQEAYPNIYEYMKNSNLIDQLTLEDGKVYTVPKAIYSHFTTGDTYLWHYSVFYRADWAKELGFEIGAQTTISELAAFAKACVEKDMAQNGKTIGITLRPGLAQELMRLGNPYFDTFAKVNGQYTWGPTMEGTVEAIIRMKNLYNDGVLDPDFYTYGTGNEMAMFTGGQAACVIYDGLVGSYDGLLNDMVAATVAEDLDAAYDMADATVLVNDDGVWFGKECANYCWANVFSWDMSEAKYLRLLDWLDWMYSEEAEEIYSMGLKNVGWFEADGAYKLIYYNDEDEMATSDPEKNLYALTANEDGTFTIGDIIGSLDDEDNTFKQPEFPSMVFWFRQAILGDDFMLVNPGSQPKSLERISRCYATRYENAMANGYRALDYDLSFFSSPAKNEYSVDINSEVLRIVADTNIAVEDVESTWNTFIDNYRVMWEPVVADLNEAFGEK